jgi:hypothetical protein
MPTNTATAPPHGCKRPSPSPWGGRQHVMPCHHALAEALRAYIDVAGIADDRKG